MNATRAKPAREAEQPSIPFVTTVSMERVLVPYWHEMHDCLSARPTTTTDHVSFDLNITDMLSPQARTFLIVWGEFSCMFDCCHRGQKFVGVWLALANQGPPPSSVYTLPKDHVVSSSTFGSPLSPPFTRKQLTSSLCHTWSVGAGRHVAPSWFKSNDREGEYGCSTA